MLKCSTSLKCYSDTVLLLKLCGNLQWGLNSQGSNKHKHLLSVGVQIVLNAVSEQMALFLKWSIVLSPMFISKSVFTRNNYSICEHLFDTNCHHLKGNAVRSKWRYGMCLFGGLHTDVYSGIWDDFTIICNHLSHSLRGMNTVVYYCLGWWWNHIILREQQDVYFWCWYIVATNKKKLTTCKCTYSDRQWIKKHQVHTVFM